MVSDDDLHDFIVALLSSRAEHDPGKGMPLRDFLRKRMANAERTRAREKKRQKKMRPLREEPVDSTDFTKAIEVTEIVWKALASLGGKERGVAVLALQFGMRIESVAEALGKSPRSVWRALEKAISKMQAVPLPEAT
jgi:RNA polymerase sigma factor (sigma-70 family)